jgi:hypothetical protein
MSCEQLASPKKRSKRQMISFRTRSTWKGTAYS